MINRITMIIFYGAVTLNLLGFFLDITGINESGKAGYFSYDLWLHISFPYWIFANIVFITVTLISGLLLSGVRFHVTSGHGSTKGKQTNKLLWENLILIPVLLGLFLMASPSEFSGEKNMDYLLKKRIVYLDGYITKDKAEKITKAITLLNAQNSAKEITLYINSDGGSIISGLNIYDAIKYSEAPVTGVVQLNAASMAVIILQACKTRKAFEYSHILIHNIKITNEWNKFEENLEEELETARYIQKNLNRLLAERSGLSLEKIVRLSRNSQMLQSKEAKKLGFIDEII